MCSINKLAFLQYFVAIWQQGSPITYYGHETVTAMFVALIVFYLYINLLTLVALQLLRLHFVYNYAILLANRNFFYVLLITFNHDTESVMIIFLVAPINCLYEKT